MRRGGKGGKQEHGRGWGVRKGQERGPGCGKTLLAKAIANECQANFISIKVSGGDKEQGGGGGGRGTQEGSDEGGAKTERSMESRQGQAP